HRPAGAALRRADASRGGLRVHGPGIPLPRAHRGARAAGCGDDALSLRPGRAPPDAHQPRHAEPAGTSRVVLGLTQSLVSIAQIAAPPLGGLLIGGGALGAWAFVAALASAAGLVAARWGSTRGPAVAREVA